MLFHNWTFAVFLLLFWPTWLLLSFAWRRRPSASGAESGAAPPANAFCLGWLVLGSYAFAAWANPLNAVLFLETTLVDYFAGLGMARTCWRRTCLAVSVINAMALFIGFKCGSTFWNVSISFFLFRSLSYTIDVYRGKIEREPSLLRYAAFVSFFPELFAGPIDRASALLPQLRQRPRVTWDDVSQAASLFAVGVFKKVALADYLARYVDTVYGAPQSYEGPALLLASLAFAWQIYFDFSGYTDMARGVGRLLGYRLAINFNHPYLATGLDDFWHRWHISLSTWFRDYVYITLGGSRHGTFRTWLNVSVTMVLSGLWHASLARGTLATFALWGLLHALGWIATKLFESVRWTANVPRLAKQLLTFSFVTLTWVFFRAQSVPEALVILRKIAAWQWADPRFPLLAAVLVILVWLFQWTEESRGSRLLDVTPVRVGLMAAMIIWLAVFSGGQSQPFIYQQF